MMALPRLRAPNTSALRACSGMVRASSQVGDWAAVTAAERYVRLGLQAGRLEDGLVDAYCGPPELADGLPLERATLVAELDALLGDVEDGWLRDQVAGLRTWAAAPASYADEVEGCYGVRPTRAGASGNSCPPTGSR